LKGCDDFHAKGKPMTREERLKAIAEMDAVIERAEHACQAYELIQMEMMAASARAKALHKQLIAKRAELEEVLGRAPHTPYAP
jgi:hypothetical protein